MNSIFDFRKIDKDYLLKNIGQERIFEYYLGIKIETKGLFCSPLREDNNPTCRLKYFGGKLKYQDFSGHFTGDCFDLVMFMHGCNFSDCMKIICNDFNIRDSNFKPKRKLKRHKVQVKEHVKSDIKVKWRDWSREDLAYWNSFGVTIELLNKYNVGAVSHVWLNNELVYKNNPKDPAYGYWFSNDEIKVYFPFRKSYRFLMNTNCIQGWNQLIESSDLLIITKALKDVMTLVRFGYNAIAPQSESQLLLEKDMEILQSRFKKIVIFYDADRAGFRTMIATRKKYPYVKCVFLTNGLFNTKNHGSKDISDLYRDNDYKHVHSILKEILNN